MYPLGSAGISGVEVTFRSVLYFRVPVPRDDLIVTAIEGVISLAVDALENVALSACWWVTSKAFRWS